MSATEAAVGEEANSPADSTHWRKREVGLAVQNALKLGGSLTITWGIGIVVRLYLPRFLGPERFGILSFADAFTATTFVVLGLGLDTYVRKEISVRPEHASDFVGGVIVLRMLLALLVFLGMEGILAATHREAEARQLVRIYGVAQLFIAGSTMSAGLLHAKGNVNGMSVLNVVSKLVWGVGIALAIFLRLGLWAFGAALAVSEGLKSSLLFALARRHLNIALRFDARATWAVIVKSLPFFVAMISTTVYNKIDMSILAVKATHAEVGWYGAATSLAGLTLLLTPLMSWVMMPLFARAAAVSEAELCSMVRRALELVLALTIPVALMMAIGADVWIDLLFGPAYAPSAMALRVLASVFVVMYVSIICWCALTMLNRTWTLTAIFTSGIVVAPVLNLLLIDPGLRLFGNGGGGVACATATLGTEIVVVSPMLIMMGKRTADARLLAVLGKTLAAVGAVVLIDSMIKERLGAWRLLVDGVAYVSLVVATRAIDVREIVGWAKLALGSRGNRGGHD